MLDLLYVVLYLRIPHGQENKRRTVPGRMRYLIGGAVFPIKGGALSSDYCICLVSKIAVFVYRFFFLLVLHWLLLPYFQNRMLQNNKISELLNGTFRGVNSLVKLWVLLWSILGVIFKTGLCYLLSLVFVSLSLVFVHVLFSCFDLLFLLVLEFMLSSQICLLPY